MPGFTKWTFFSFVSDAGERAVHEWYKTQSADVKAALNVSLKYLRDRPIKDWVRPATAALKGGCYGLVEIRFECSNVEYRPLGFFGPNYTFIIVFFAIEKGGRFEPATACKTALYRKRIIQEMGGHSCEWKVF